MGEKRVMEGLFANPLFVGAHVDDVELFAGGTIHRFRENARVISFSRHKGVLPSPPSEFWSSLAELGVEDRGEASDLPACQAGEVSFVHNRQFIHQVLIGHEPSVAVTHQSTDTNQDHRAIYEEVLRVFKGKCPIICGAFFNNDTPFADRRMFVKIGREDLDAKIRAIQCYRSQRVCERPYFDEVRIEAEARYFGGMIGAEFAEAFEIIRIWG